MERVPLDTKYVSPTELRAVVPARLTRTAGTYFLRVPDSPAKRWRFGPRTAHGDVSMTRRALGCADVLRRSGWVALPIVCTWLVVSLVAQQSVTSAALQGTWALRSLSYDGVPQTATGYMIFQGSHYSS